MNYNEEIILPQYVPPLGNSRIKWPNSQLENKGLMLNLDGTLDEIMDAVEKSLLQKTLKQTNGNKTMAAKLLGIAIRSLYNKLEKHKLLILSFALLKYEYGVFIHGIKGVLA